LSNNLSTRKFESDISSLEFSPKSEKIIVGTKKGEVFLIKPENEIKSFQGHSKPIIKAQSNFYERWMITVSKNNTITWDFNSGKKLAEEQFSEKGITALAIHNRLGLASGADKTLYLFKVETLGTESWLQNTENFSKLVFISDQTVLGISKTKIFKINIDSLDIIIFCNNAHEKDISNVALSNDEKTLAVASKKSEIIKLWDFKTGKEKKKHFMGHPANIVGLSALENGKFVSVCSDGVVKKWFPDELKSEKTVYRKETELNMAKISPSGIWEAASIKNTLYVYKLNDS
jgi:WD40 repeat protein